MLTTTELKELLEKAKKATPGPWYVDHDQVAKDLDSFSTDNGIADCSIAICTVARISPELDHAKNDRKFIASANPQVVTHLIGRLMEAEEQNKELKDIISKIAHQFDQQKLYGLTKSDEVKNRFFKFIEINGDCIEWTGSLNPQGYGQISIGNRPYLAHRVAMAIHDPCFYDFYTVDHKCRNRKCVKVEHLRCVGDVLNATENSSSTSHDNSTKTHCKNGHELFGDNLRFKRNKNGTGKHRVCKTCAKASKDKFNKSQREHFAKYPREKV